MSYAVIFLSFQFNALTILRFEVFMFLRQSSEHSAVQCATAVAQSTVRCSATKRTRIILPESVDFSMLSRFKRTIKRVRFSHLRF